MPKLTGISLLPQSDGSLLLVAASPAGKAGATMWLTSQTGPDGPWGGWQEFGQPGYGDPGRPAVIQRTVDGRLEVFVVTSGDHAVWHRWQAGQVPDAWLHQWSDWETLGQPGGQPARGPVALALLADATVMAVVTAGGAVWQATSAPEPEKPWPAWSSLGGPPGTAVLAVTAVLHINNCVEVVALAASPAGGSGVAATTGDLWRRRQTVAGGDSWSGWELLGRPTGWPATMPVLIPDFSGRMELFTRAEDGMVWRKGQQNGYDPSSWGPWQALDPPWLSFGDLAAGLTPSGTVLLVATSSVGDDLWYSIQSETEPDTFCPLTPLATVPTAAPGQAGALAGPALVLGQDDRVQLFVVLPASGDLYQVSSAAPGDLPSVGHSWPEP
jgi:hypothetical protein